MRADIHHGPEQTLHKEAGYISARPTSSSPKASCDARPVHTFGSEGELVGTLNGVCFDPESGRGKVHR